MHDQTTIELASLIIALAIVMTARDDRPADR